MIPSTGFRKTQILLLLFIVSFPIAISGDRAFTKNHASLITDIKKIIRLKMKQGLLPGIAVSLVDREGILWTTGFGVRNKKNEPVTPDTIFSIQSASKTITATAVMLAIDRGILDPDKPLTRYLPWLKLNSIFEPDPGKKITLRHLLGHSAGFSHEAPVGNNHDADAVSFTAHIRSISGTWLRFPVGKSFGYSNLGIDLAGYILQTASKTNFAAWVDGNLCLTLGMKNSSFCMKKILGNANRAVSLEKMYYSVPVRIPMIPSGGFYSSARDLAEFIRFHLNFGLVNGKQLLGRKRLLEMYSPLLSGLNYALAIQILRRNGMEYLYHGGAGFGFNSIIIWSPGAGFGLVVLCNSSHSLSLKEVHPPYSLALAIIDRIQRESIPLFRKENLPPGQDLPKYGNVRDKPVFKPIRSVIWPYLDKRRQTGKDETCRSGLYVIKSEGIPFYTGFISITRKNRNLYANGKQLHAFKPGLYMDRMANTFDFRSSPVRWRNIAMEKVFPSPVFQAVFLALILILQTAAALFWAGKGVQHLIGSGSGILKKHGILPILAHSIVSLKTLMITTLILIIVIHRDTIFGGLFTSSSYRTLGFMISSLKTWSCVFLALSFMSIILAIIVLHEGIRSIFHRYHFLSVVIFDMILTYSLWRWNLLVF